MFVHYSNTNESLDAVVAGLDLKSTDRVLAICGSGDQALAMAEYAGSVLALDTNQSQKYYALERIQSIANGQFREFLKEVPRGFSSLSKWERFVYTLFMQKDHVISLAQNAKAAREYFAKPGRIEAIRNKLDAIEIMEGDIFKYDAQGNPFEKIYLSNALEYGANADEPFVSRPELIHRINRITAVTSPNGLVYITFGRDNYIYNRVIKEEMKKAFRFEGQLTAKAKVNETHLEWQPTVYRKVA